MLPVALVESFSTFLVFKMLLVSPFESFSLYLVATFSPSPMLIVDFFFIFIASTMPIPFLYVSLDSQKIVVSPFVSSSLLIVSSTLIVSIFLIFESFFIVIVVIMLIFVPFSI